MAAYLSATSGFCSHSLSAVGDLVTFGLLGCNRRRVLYALLPSIINIMMGRGEKRSHGYTNTGEGSIHSFPWPASHFDADSHYTHTHTWEFDLPMLNLSCIHMPGEWEYLLWHGAGLLDSQCLHMCGRSRPPPRLNVYSNSLQVMPVCNKSQTPCPVQWNQSVVLILL